VFYRDDTIIKSGSPGINTDNNPAKDPLLGEWYYYKKPIDEHLDVYHMGYITDKYENGQFMFSNTDKIDRDKIYELPYSDKGYPFTRMYSFNKVNAPTTGKYYWYINIKDSEPKNNVGKNDKSFFSPNEILYGKLRGIIRNIDGEVMTYEFGTFDYYTDDIYELKYFDYKDYLKSYAEKNKNKENNEKSAMLPEYYNPTKAISDLYGPQNNTIGGNKRKQTKKAKHNKTRKTRKIGRKGRRKSYRRKH
jgi:hypothetical protein